MHIGGLINTVGDEALVAPSDSENVFTHARVGPMSRLCRCPLSVLPSYWASHRICDENRITIGRMVQLPATAAIEYVAAFGRRDFWPGVLLSGGSFARGTFPQGSFARGHFWPGGFLSGCAFVRGSFAWGDFCPRGLCPFPQVQCVYALSRLSVPSIVA